MATRPLTAAILDRALALVRTGAAHEADRHDRFCLALELTRNLTPSGTGCQTTVVSSAESRRSDTARRAGEKFVSVTPVDPGKNAADVWHVIREQIKHREVLDEGSRAPANSVMEVGVTVLRALDEAPLRTLHSPSLVRSSPLSAARRAMLEKRQFGHRYDAFPVDLASIEHRLPRLECPHGDVEFLADDRTFEDLNLSVDCLLRHRKKLLEPRVDRSLPRKHVFVLGAGPGGLMTAIQLRLRDHEVIICEQREVYARNRYIGVYKEVTHLMASLGMPERMTYDFSQYRGKRGIMLADIQTFLHGIALRLGVIIYMGAVPRSLTPQQLANGEVELQRAARSSAGAPGHSSIGMMRWHFDTVSRVRSGVTIRFDTIVEATGGRAGLRELLVGPENVVSIRAVAKAAAARDTSLQTFFDDPEDHCAEYVESGYGCPPGLRKSFATALLSGGKDEIPDEVPCFVSNIDASIFNKPMSATADSLGLASRIGDRDLAIPHDWVVLECRLADQTLSRYHIEGPLPQTFEFGEQRLSTRDALDKLNPVSLLFRILYAMGVPFDAIDRRRLIEFYTTESSYGDASDIVSTWVGTFRGLRLGGDKPIWCGTVPGSDMVEYAIVGEALQNAWYRFGVGVDDTFAAASRFAEGLDLVFEERLKQARRFERVMSSRSVQILYHLYGVAQHVDQGVVGPVLTEYHIDEQHSVDVAKAGLLEAARQGGEMLAAETDIHTGGTDPLLEAALDYERESLCRRVLTLLKSFSYRPDVLRQAQQPLKPGDTDWRTRAFSAIESVLSVEHRELLSPLFRRALPQRHGDAPGDRTRRERLVELAMGRYSWVSAWLRACALHALDPSAPGASAALTRGATDPDPLIAQTATAALAAIPGSGVVKLDRCSPIERVLVLKEVSLFKTIPHEVLAGVAALVTERWAAPNERIVEKGEPGDCLYVIESGSVRVHDGGRKLLRLGPHQVFGELSLLDAAPRSASVSALEPTRLFRLPQADFYALMNERPEISRAINRVLCGMIRAANAANASYLS